jgi:hypothetical protein
MEASACLGKVKKIYSCFAVAKTKRYWVTIRFAGQLNDIASAEGVTTEENRQRVVVL